MTAAVRVHVDVRPQQLELLQSTATVQWIGTGTKTGKTTAFALWLADGILKGEPTAWCGPWTAKTRMGYKLTKRCLAEADRRGEVHFNDSLMTIESRLEGSFHPYTGDNPEAIFGEAYKRFVIDEASRQTEVSLTAALTTISATQGQIKLGFNLEHGVKNWAIRNLLRVQAMTPEERAAASEAYLLFPTLDAGFVTPAYVAMMRNKMPEATFNALFYAIIPEADSALFRNLEEIFTGPETLAPVKGHTYVMGLDVARKRNWTVPTVMDLTTGRVVDTDRFHEVSWTIQYERAAAMYQRWRCLAAAVDAGGLGDPVVEELSKRRLNVVPVIFSRNQHNNQRKELIEAGVVACDQKAISAPGTARFRQYRQELGSFEYQLTDRGEVVYGVPEGLPDDCAFSLFLANKLRLEGASLGPFTFAAADPKPPAGYRGPTLKRDLRAF